jgi:hypothetical protein
MRIFLFVLALVALLAGASVLASAKSAVHEIEAFVLFLIAATFLTGSALVEALMQGFKSVGETNTLLVKLSADIQAARDTPRSEAAAIPPIEAPGYWVRIGTDTNGPFPAAKIRELHRRGAIDNDTPVVREGEKDWKRAHEVIGA